MPRIQKLGSSVVNQIAAGEVVIQPCSVMKEVTENSLDAGASSIEVHFNGSGADGIVIKDNGMGMDPEDLMLAIEPHATSKIQNAEDLYRVASFGFRGEALASIAEVSHFEILSKTKDGVSAHRLYKKMVTNTMWSLLLELKAPPSVLKTFFTMFPFVVDF